MGQVPAIPEPTRSSITVRLLDHAERNWPQLAKVRARYHGSFAYITGVLRDGSQIPLFRLRYGGSAHSFGFAIYSPARDRYQERRPAHRAAHRQPARSTRHRLHRPSRRTRTRTRTLTPTNFRGHPLKIRKKQQDADRDRAGDGWIDTGLVFTTRYGTPIEPRNFNRSFDRCIVAARVPRITVHGTRKTCASLLAALDVHPRVAMRILRHSKIAVTMEFYTEAPSDAIHDALRKLSDWLT